MKTNKLTFALILLFSSLAFLSSCKKETLSDSIDKSDAPTADSRSTIEFTSSIKSTIDESADYASYFAIYRGSNIPVYEEQILGYKHNEIANKTTKFDLQSGDRLTITTYGSDGSKLVLSVFEGEIKINGKVTKTHNKACSNFLLVYDMP